MPFEFQKEWKTTSTLRFRDFVRSYNDEASRVIFITQDYDPSYYFQKTHVSEHIMVHNTLQSDR